MKRVLFSLIIGFFFIIILSKFVDIDLSGWHAIVAGTVCALIYVLSGFFSYYFASARRQQLFLRIFVYSLAIRFVVVLALILIVLKFTSVNQAYFLVSFFAWYFVFQIWEVVSMNNLSRKKA